MAGSDWRASDRALARDTQVNILSNRALDKPVSALDVSIQAAIINLLCDLEAWFWLTCCPYVQGLIRYPVRVSEKRH